MKTITIGGNDYTFEFTIEASLYSECTEKVTGLMVGAGSAQMEEENSKENIKAMLSTMSDIPSVAMTMFYAGLMEHHGSLGDGKVKNIKEAKLLVKQYLSEHKNDEKGNFYALMQEMMECMADDGFFELIGLDKMFTPAQEKKKTPKTPQDHKKKATVKAIEN